MSTISTARAFASILKQKSPPSNLSLSFVCSRRHRTTNASLKLSKVFSGHRNTGGSIYCTNRYLSISLSHSNFDNDRCWNNFKSSNQHIVVKQSGTSLTRGYFDTALSASATTSSSASPTAISLKSQTKKSPSEERETEEYITDEYQKVYIAVGSNMGDRFGNIMTAINHLQDTKEISGDPLVRNIRTSSLIDTPPMYITDQPPFLNGAIEIETKLSPHALLSRLKEIEKQVGRDLENALRNGPRPVDLDILFYGAGGGGDSESSCNVDDGSNIHGGQQLETSRLSIPHPRLSEREFVLSPICDLERNLVHPQLDVTVGELLEKLHADTKNASSEDDNEHSSSAIHVLPLPRGRMMYFNETIIMGILNVTPDSFSDGGKYEGSVDLALKQAMQLITDGAGIIDIGGESTRPGAKEVETGLELERTIPIIKKIREVSDIPISIDTRHALVAKEAIAAGADIVNDVSGGTHDPLMLETVSNLNVPMVLMHMRGTPETMQSMTDYEDVVDDVGASLRERSSEAERAGIPRWLQILDPGIGFAKDLEQNLSLLKHSDRLRSDVNNIPLLLGPSRKGFIGKIIDETKPEERDFGSISACITTLLAGKHNAPTVLRVHNVKAAKDATTIMHAIMKAT